MLYVGVDLHHKFCLITALDSTGVVREQVRLANDRSSLRGYFQRWSEAVDVAVEACSFSGAFVETVQPLVRRLVLVHPQRVKAIASAKLKNDRVDSATLAHLLRLNYLPESWIADPETRGLRHYTRLRIRLGQERTRWKNQIHAILHQQGLRAPVSDLFGRGGRAWLAALELPATNRHVIDTALRQIDSLDQAIDEEERRLRDLAEADPRAHYLTTIPGVGDYSAMVMLAEIGDIRRFPDKRQLYSYAGLVPWVRESAQHCWRGHITRAGSPYLRWIMIEAAVHATCSSPSARRYFERLARRRPRHVARVALARKLLGAVYALLRHGVCFDEQAFAAM
jgi:transposase